MSNRFAGEGNNDVMQTGTISDTVARVGRVSHLKKIDNVSYQLITTGDLQGAWKIEESNSYAGASDAGDGAPLAAGTWLDVTARFGSANFTDYYPTIAAVTAASNQIITVRNNARRAIRPTFTPASGTGVAYAHVIGKGF